MAKQKRKDKGRFLKKVDGDEDARVYPYTSALVDERNDMRECDKDGNFMKKKKAGTTVKGSVEDKIKRIGKKTDMMDLALEYDIEFEANMKLTDMKKGLVAELAKRAKQEDDA